MKESCFYLLLIFIDHNKIYNHKLIILIFTNCMMYDRRTHFLVVALKYEKKKK